MPVWSTVERLSKLRPPTREPPREGAYERGRNRVAGICLYISWQRKSGVRYGMDMQYSSSV